MIKIFCSAAIPKLPTWVPCIKRFKNGVSHLCSLKIDQVLNKNA